GLAHEDPCGGKTGRDRRNEILFRGCVVAGHQPDAAWQEGQRSLALEQSFGCELLLEALEGGKVIAEAEPLQRERPQAEVATRLEELGSSEDMDALAVGQVQAQCIEAGAPDRHSETGPV